MSTILVVDDESSIREVVCELLKAYEFEAISAQCVLQAYDVLCERHIDIVLCDVIMPDGDGTELKRLMLSDARFTFTPFVFMTALAPEKEHLNGLVLRKPFNVTQLLAIIKDGLNGKGKSLPPDIY